MLFGKRGHDALLLELIQFLHLVHGMTPDCVVTARDSRQQLTGEDKSAFSVCRETNDSSTRGSSSPTGLRLMSGNCL